MASRSAGSIRIPFRDFDALAFVLDQIPVGGVLLYHSGRAAWMNWSARQILEVGDGITLRDGRLVPASPSDTTELGRMAERAIGANRSARSRASDTIALQTGGDALCLVAVVRSIAPAATMRSEDGREGERALLEKREPRFRSV